MIVTEISELKNKCENVSLEEGIKIGEQLSTELEKTNGIGLAANQIGVNANVCLIKVKDPILLINPEIIEKSKEKFLFIEGCLSFPEKVVKVIRHKWVKVKTDNHPGEMLFSVWNKNNEDGYDKDKYLSYALETACVQHEIDHLNGITMFDREIKLNTEVKKEKIGRNTKVSIKKDNQTKILKYKKAEKLLEDGWTLVE